MWRELGHAGRQGALVADSLSYIYIYKILILIIEEGWERFEYVIFMYTPQDVIPRRVLTNPTYK